jgi:cytochrome P450
LVGSIINPVTFDPTNSEFMKTAHLLYAQLRQECPVARARIVGAGGGDVAPQTEVEIDAERRSPIVPDVWLITGYDNGVGSLRDDRFSVNPLFALPPEVRATMSDEPKEFLPLSRSLLTLDPPDHTRLRQLVQPWFTGRAVDALRPRIE